MPLAVLGGSFDPVHCGHVAMANHVLQCGLARDVLVIPAFNSPFKSGTGASAEDRLEMVRQAFETCPNCSVDDREVRRGGTSYMVETLEELQHQNPDRSLRLIIGADNVADFPQWKRSADILKIAKILVLGRHGNAEKISGALSASFIVAPAFDQRVSSTEIRAILAAGQPVAGLLPSAVIRHIRKNDLYN